MSTCSRRSGSATIRSNQARFSAKARVAYTFVRVPERTARTVTRLTTRMCLPARHARHRKSCEGYV